jgi:hypothetical protein
MTAPLFGLLTEFQSELKELAHNLLLVAGGYLVGYLLGGPVGWAVGKWVFRLKAPDGFRKVGRPVGGIVLAIVVALIVFTGKGKPSGDGGDGKGSPNSETTPGKNSAPTVEPNPKIDHHITTPKIDLTPPELTIRVTILAGSAVRTDGKFYLLNDEEQAKSISELKNSIEEQKSKVKGRIVLVILFPTNPDIAPPRNDRKVTDLTRWATDEAGLGVNFPSTR